VGWTIKDSSLSRHCCSDYVKIRSVRIVEIHAIVSHITILCYAQKYFTGFIYVADNNNTYLGLHVKCPIVVSNFNRLWNFSTRFRKVYQYQISQKYLQWGPCWYVHTDRQTDRQTDRHEEASKRFSRLCQRAKKPIRIAVSQLAYVLPAWVGRCVLELIS
jgi:hypothetical protein